MQGPVLVKLHIGPVVVLCDFILIYLVLGYFLDSIWPSNRQPLGANGVTASIIKKKKIQIRDIFSKSLIKKKISFPTRQCT